MSDDERDKSEIIGHFQEQPSHNIYEEEQREDQFQNQASQEIYQQEQEEAEAEADAEARIGQVNRMQGDPDLNAINVEIQNEDDEE